MPAAVHTGGATHTLKGIYARTADGLQAVAVARARNAANALKLLFGSLSAALSSDSAIGRINSSSAQSITTRAASVTATGGQEPYSYLWSNVSVASGTWGINSPTSDTTTFTGGAASPGDVLSATFHCVVTDGAGQTVTTGAVTATVTNISSGGGGPLP